MSLQDTYINPFTDFGFKKLFGEEPNKELHTVQLKNQHGDVFYDKLTFIYLTLPNFTKPVDELQTMQDKWFYAFKHLHELDHIPAALQERVFKHLFKAAQIAQFEPKEREAYENSLKYYRDLKNVTDTAHEAGIEEGFEQGLERGLEKGRQNVARKMLQSGLPVEQIAEFTELTESQVRVLI